MDWIGSVFETSPQTFQAFSAAHPWALWLNVVSEATLATAFFSVLLATFFATYKIDKITLAMMALPAGFCLFSGLARVLAIVASWQPYYVALILFKTLSALFCVLTAAIIIPNLRRVVRLSQLEASERVRKQLEKEIEGRRESDEALRFFELMITKSSEGIIAMCLERSKIFYTNPQFDRMFGFEEGELTGKNLDLIRLPQDEDSPLRERIVQGVDSAGVWREEVRAARKDGSRFWTKVGLTRTKHPNFGSVYIAFVTDISARKKAESQLKEQQLLMAASAKMAALGEMAAGIGHEINNPLASIQANAEDLKDMVQTGRASSNHIVERLARIEKTCERIAKIIEGLRLFAREEKSGVLHNSRVSELVAETIELCGERFRQHGIDLRIPTISPDLKVQCRPEQISQVLLNLLMNAYDAVMDLAEKWVELTVTAEQGQVVMRVRDSGVGVPKDIQSQIMQPFFTTKEPGKGMGLGLSISQGIVRNHEGSLELNSAAPHTEFEVRLPLAKKA